MQTRVKDICAYRDAMYLSQRAEHITNVAGPDGMTHNVDMLRLLCLTEMFDYGLTSAELRALPGRAAGVFATQNIAAGDIVTFFPGDHVAFAPVPGCIPQLRLSSDRARNKPLQDMRGAHSHAIDPHFTIQGDPDCVDNPNYLAHMLCSKRNGTAANCKLTAMHGIAVAAVATRDIAADEELHLI